MLYHSVIAQAKRELERKLQIANLQTTADEADRSTERKLKKELKKLRILYKDAKHALDSQVSMYICDALRDLAQFVQFKKHEKYPWRSVTFSKSATF